RTSPPGARCRRAHVPGARASSFDTVWTATSTPASRSQRTSSSTARFSPEGTRDEYRLWTTRALMVRPAIQDWTARETDLTLRSHRWLREATTAGGSLRLLGSHRC